VTSKPDEVIATIERTLQTRQAYVDGKELRFLCTIHSDTNPSARWNPEKQTWFCDVCKRGGGYLDLAQRLGISTQSERMGNGQDARRIVRTYDYRDEQNELLYQVVRYEPKDFRQRRPDGTGGWAWDLKGVRPVAHGLPSLAGQSRVYIVEGEKDVERLRSLGISATCNSGGAGKWTNDLTQQLLEAGVQEVIVLSDNDDPGRKHAESVARSCFGSGLAVKILALPGLPPKGDVSDFLDAGNTAADLQSLAEAAAEWAPEETKDTAVASSPDESGETEERQRRFTDVGNAERFVRQHGAYSRYCYPLRSWFVCNEGSSIWERCPGNRVMQLGKAAVMSLYDEARREADDEQRTKLAAHAVKSESAQRLQALIDLARSEPGIAISPEAFDRDPWLFSLASGVIELKTGNFRARRRDDLITKQSPVQFDPAATCPIWLQFLARIFQSDQRLIEFVQQAVGYALTGVTVEQVFFLLWGSGSNGKSTLLKVLLKLLGDYGLQMPADTFLSRTQDGRATPDLARLQGARLAVAIESDEGCRLAEGTIKQMTGSDRIAARRLYQDFIEFEPSHKIFFATNHKPRVKDNTHAMWRRMRLIPFEVQIADSEQDPALPDKLVAELPGILNWALAGCLAWQQVGRLITPEAVVNATASYRTEQDVLDDFLRERCVRGAADIVKFAELRKNYGEWAGEFSERPLSSKAFAAALQERGFRPLLLKNARHYAGLRLRTINDDLADATAGPEKEDELRSTDNNTEPAAVEMPDPAPSTTEQEALYDYDVD
jgi:putative DNA primase/helicase